MATYADAGKLVGMDAEVYIYDRGFLYSKVLMIDDELLSIGKTNIDVFYKEILRTCRRTI